MKSPDLQHYIIFSLALVLLFQNVAYGQEEELSTFTECPKSCNGHGRCIKLGHAIAGCHIPVQTALVESVQMVPHGLIFQLQTTLPIKLLSARTRDTVTRAVGCVFAEKVSQETLARDSYAPWTLTLASSVLEMGIA